MPGVEGEGGAEEVDGVDGAEGTAEAEGVEGVEEGEGRGGISGRGGHSCRRLRGPRWPCNLPRSRNELLLPPCSASVRCRR